MIHPPAVVLAALLIVSLAGSTAADESPSEAGHRAEAIRRYEALLDNPSPALSGRQDELMFRLALLYIEEAEASAARSGPAAARGYYARSLGLLDKVLARKDTLFREDALYYRGIALQETGRDEESLGAFRTILREFPQGPRSGEIWFRIGNDAIQKNRLPEALQAYEEVLRRADPNYRDQAAYMFAWSAFSLHQEGRARATLVDLLQRLEAGGQQETSLYPESVELLAKVIRNEGNPSVLSGPWIGSRPAFAPVVLRRVADLFRETSDFRQAALAYEQLLREYPDTADVDAVERTIIDSWIKGGDPARAQEARMRLIRRHLDGEHLRAESAVAIAPIARDSALYLHARARETKQPDLFRQAIEAYRLHAASIPEGPERRESTFFQAEALKEVGDVDGATERYRLVAESRDPAHGEEAAFRRVALLEDLKQAGRATVDQVIGAYEDYFRVYPTGKREAELRTRYAGYLFDQQRYSDTLVAGGQLVARTSDPAERQRLKLMLARAAFAAADYFQASNWAVQLLGEPALSDKTRSEAEEIHVAAIYKAAESLGDRPIEAAAQYELVAARYPRHKSAPAALYNAAVLLRDAGEKARALQLFRRLIDTYPQADLYRDATAAATAIYKEMGDAVGAAAVLERAASGRPGPESSDYLFQAAVAAESSGSAVKTIELYRKFLKSHAPNDLRAAQARLAIAKASWQLGQTPEAERVARQTLAHLPIGGPDSAAVQVIAAEARLVLGNAALQRFEAIRLNEPTAANLGKKQQALDQAVEELGRAAAFGFADISLASLYKIGYAQLDFAKSIMEAPRPKNLSPDQLVQYESLLQEQVRPYREAAERSFRKALDQGTAAGVENEWTARARVALAEFDGGPPAAVAPGVPILPGS